MTNHEDWIDRIDRQLKQQGYKAGTVCFRDRVSVGLALAFCEAAKSTFKGQVSGKVHGHLNFGVWGTTNSKDAERIRSYVTAQHQVLQTTIKSSYDKNR